MTVRPFSFAARALAGSPPAVTRVRFSLAALFIVSCGFAAWSWLRPYAWAPDPAARCKIVETLVTRDNTFFWVEVHLKITPGQTHDLRQPLFLALASGKKLDPADTTLGGIDGRGTTDLWVKFWLDRAEIDGPLDLHLNGGKLRVKNRTGVPSIENEAFRNFTTQRW